MSQLQPCILPTFGLALEAKDMKKDVDSYMMERPEESLFLSNLNMKLLLSSSKVKTSGSHYNVPLLNSLVLYVGTKAIEQLLPSTTNPHDLPADFFPGACLDIFKKLIQKSEGRYLFFNAVANHLRYPNNHTYYFSFLMLHFFTETKQEEIKEQIASVLLKRLIIKPPHPWGVKFTFLELVKNPRYKFWKLKFTKNNPNYKSVLMQFQDIG